MKSKRQFILDTLLPYKNDPNLCGYENNRCRYITSDGKPCAAGKHMKEGEWQGLDESIGSIISSYGEGAVFTDEAFQQDLNIDEWESIQTYHDNIANDFSDYVRNRDLDYLEKVTGLEFPELRFGD